MTDKNACPDCESPLAVDHYIGVGCGGWLPVYACPKCNQSQEKANDY